MTNFIILFIITFLVVHFLCLAMNYGPPCGAGQGYLVITVAIIISVLPFFYNKTLVFNWQAIVIGIATYIVIRLIKYGICELIDKYTT